MIQLCDIKIHINPNIKTFYEYFDREDFNAHEWTNKEVEYILNCGLEHAKIYSSESYFSDVAHSKLIEVDVTIPFSDVKIINRDISGWIYVNFDIEPVNKNRTFATGIAQFIESNIYKHGKNKI